MQQRKATSIFKTQKGELKLKMNGSEQINKTKKLEEGKKNQ